MSAGFGGTVVVVPALDAAATIRGVLERLPTTVFDAVGAVLVVDNASDDGTVDEVRAWVAASGFERLTLLRNPRNFGYGGSQQLAYRWALDRGFRSVALLHADAQYPPELLPELLAPLRTGRADVVFGSRIAGAPLAGGMPLVRWVGNRVLTRTQNALLGLDLTEFHSGFRAYDLGLLSRLPFERLTPEFHFDTEILLLAHQAGARVVEFPIPTRYAGEPNHVNLLRYGLDVLATTTSYALHTRGLRVSPGWRRLLRPVLTGTSVQPRAR